MTYERGKEMPFNWMPKEHTGQGFLVQENHQNALESHNIHNANGVSLRKRYNEMTENALASHPEFHTDFYSPPNPVDTTWAARDEFQDQRNKERAESFHTMAAALKL
jgi:hypothetical protein